jgi:hypothetical protein
LLSANGITSARNMSAPWAHLAEIREWRKQIESGQRVGPQLITSGPLLDGPGTGRPTVQLVIAGGDEGWAAVRRVKSEGADFVKVYNLLSRDSYFAIAEESRAQSLPFSGHVPFAVSALEASDAGQLSLEHLDGILLSASAQEQQLRTQAQGWRADRQDGRVGGPVSAKVLVESFSADKLRRLAIRLAARATRVVPTLSLNWNRFAQSMFAAPIGSGSYPSRTQASGSVSSQPALTLKTRCERVPSWGSSS